MFALTADPIDAQHWRSRLDAPEGGALVVFEGRVREVNLGRKVTLLEYEGAEKLAAAEFDKIAAETRARFQVLGVVCVHRVGRLAVGDVAVWIGVTAAHRGPAFDGCRHVIDELKKRLPIWKKEHYTDGDSGWINSP